MTLVRFVAIKVKNGLACFFLFNFALKVNQISKNVWDSIFNNICNPKPRETGFKLMQARTKISDKFVNLFLLN